MAPVTNAQLILAERPTGHIIPGKTTVYDTSKSIDADGVALEGGILIKTLMFSPDPFLRNRMDNSPLGQPLMGFGLGKIVRSDNSAFKTGDIIEGRFNTQEYNLIVGSDIESRTLRVIHNNDGLPLSAFIGILGMPGKTAYYGWKEHAQAKKGEVVFVTTGAGAVGSAVIQIAKLDGCRVIASAGSDEKVAYMKEIGADVAFNYKTTNTPEILEKEGGIDIYWDNVGGEILNTVLANTKQRARILVCGMISGYNGPKFPITNLHLIIYKEVHIYGFLYSGLNAKYSAEFEEVFPRWIKEGKIKYLEDITKGLENLGHAMLAQHKGENKGKSVVIVADD